MGLYFFFFFFLFFFFLVQSYTMIVCAAKGDTNTSAVTTTQGMYAFERPLHLVVDGHASASILISSSTSAASKV